MPLVAADCLPVLHSAWQQLLVFPRFANGCFFSRTLATVAFFPGPWQGLHVLFFPRSNINFSNSRLRSWFKRPISTFILGNHRKNRSSRLPYWVVSLEVKNKLRIPELDSTRRLTKAFNYSMNKHHAIELVSANKTQKYQISHKFSVLSR